MVLIGIIATLVYIFVGGPNAAANRVDASEANRRELVWARLNQLEAQRRDMLLRASMRSGSAFLPPARASRGGPWAKGYHAGFAQGYYVGSYLAETRRPNPLFFPIPR